MTTSRNPSAEVSNLKKQLESSRKIQDALQQKLVREQLARLEEREKATVVKKDLLQQLKEADTLKKEVDAQKKAATATPASSQTFLSYLFGWGAPTSTATALASANSEVAPTKTVRR